MCVWGGGVLEGGSQRERLIEKEKAGRQRRCWSEDQEGSLGSGLFFHGCVPFWIRENGVGGGGGVWGVGWCTCEWGWVGVEYRKLYRLKEPGTHPPGLAIDKSLK